MGKIVAVLEISDDFDQYFESQPLFDETDAPDECANSSVEAMMSYLQVTSRADVTRVIDRLPVFPRAAREVVRQVTNPDAGPRELAAVCSLDPLLAGRLIQIANSAFYSPRLPIGTIFHAVSFIGTETTRRVLAGGRATRQLCVAAVAPHLEPQPGCGANRRDARSALLHQD